MRTVISTLLLWSCVGGVPTDTGKTGDLRWFTTCGDPVCQGYTGPFDGVPLCTTEAEGDACDADGAQCDPQDDCNALLICATDDPKDQTGGCPISRKERKTDIAYLDDAGKRSAAREALGIKLATWRYRGEEARSSASGS
jgi:hypothetical protein